MRFNNLFALSMFSVCLGMPDKSADHLNIISPPVSRPGTGNPPVSRPGTGNPPVSRPGTRQSLSPPGGQRATAGKNLGSQPTLRRPPPKVTKFADLYYLKLRSSYEGPSNSTFPPFVVRGLTGPESKSKSHAPLRRSLSGSSTSSSSSPNWSWLTCGELLQIYEKMSDHQQKECLEIIHEFSCKKPPTKGQLIEFYLGELEREDSCLCPMALDPVPASHSIQRPVSTLRFIRLYKAAASKEKERFLEALMRLYSTSAIKELYKNELESLFGSEELVPLR